MRLRLVNLSRIPIEVIVLSLAPFTWAMLVGLSELPLIVRIPIDRSSTNPIRLPRAMAHLTKASHGVPTSSRPSPGNECGFHFEY